MLKKTGLDEEDVKRLFKLSIWSFITFCFYILFTSCSRNGYKTDIKTSSDDYKVEKGTSSQTQINTDLIQPPSLGPSQENKNCGPTPGYPCGTKYYTVSIRDFKGNS